MRKKEFPIFDRVSAVELHGLAINDSHVEHLCKMKSLESISLNLTDITDDGMARLRNAHPNAVIEQFSKEDAVKLASLQQPFQIQLKPTSFKGRP